MTTEENKPHLPHSPHSLESLVPPLDLCKQIPPGAFEDSCFVRPDNVPGNPVWTRGTKIYFHELACGIKFYAAPTLQEIMDALWKFKPRVWRNKNLDPEVPAWGIALNEDNFTGHCGFVQDNPATAALKLWMRVKGESIK